MNVSLGDLAQSFLLQRQSNALRMNLVQVSGELSSGRVGDVSSELGGNFSALGSIERSLATLDAYDTSTGEAAFFAETMQDTLATVQTFSTELGPSLIVTANSGDADLMGAASADALGRLEASVDALNKRIGDRAIFSGTATDTDAFADVPTILASVIAAVGGATTAADVEIAVTAWFETPGGGFETDAYLASAAPRANLRLNAETDVEIGITGQDPEIRGALKGLVLAALIGENIPPNDPTEQANLGRIAGEALLGATSGVVALRAEIGAAQERIETAQVQNASERTALRIARSELVEVDPFDRAIELEAVQAQLETLYTITARMSRLSLVNFLR